MKKLQFEKLFLLFVFSILFATGIHAQKIQPVDLVNPFIDTGAPRSRWFFFSSASRPFGMVNLSPDMWTKGDWGSGYLYDGEYIRCFSHIHAWEMGGLIPRGYTGGNYSHVMLGDPSASFFATAYNKGIRNYDTELAYEGLRKNAFPGGMRNRAGYEDRFNASGGGISYYVERGYVPHNRPDEAGFHSHASASMTLEYAYQDWSLAQLALKMDKLKDYDYFMKRSQNYKNLWNNESGYFVPRDMNGNWINNFDPLNNEGFCESNSAIYSHHVPHDMPGLIQLNGGPKKYTKKLDTQFRKSEINGFCMASHRIRDEANWTDYCNEPGHGMAHLFNHSGSPWLSQYWVRKVHDEFTDITPYGGYKGDEDQGKRGSLGVLMAIGLFETDGGASAKPSYEMTSPIFDKITLHLNNDYYPGKTFVIETENNSNENIYIQKAILNEKQWNKFRFSHEDFIKGGHLKIILGNKPNKKWGIK